MWERQNRIDSVGGRELQRLRVLRLRTGMKRHEKNEDLYN
jgi:hypothetical protein